MDLDENGSCKNAMLQPSFSLGKQGQAYATEQESMECQLLMREMLRPGG